MVRFIPWSSQTKRTFPPPVYISHNLNHLSASHVTFSRLSLGLRVYSSPLFLDPVSLLMAYQHKWLSLFLFCFSYHGLLSWLVFTCLHLSLRVLTCLALSWLVLTCLDLSWLVLTWTFTHTPNPNPNPNPHPNPYPNPNPNLNPNLNPNPNPNPNNPNPNPNPNPNNPNPNPTL